MASTEGKEDFDANATLQSLFTPPGLEQAEEASPITDVDTSAGETEEVTMKENLINIDPATVTSKGIETYTLKQPQENHSRILYGFTEGLINTRDEYRAKFLSMKNQYETVKIELDKVSYEYEAEKEALIQELDTIAKQRDEAILNLDAALGKKKPDAMKTNSSLDSFLSFQPLQTSTATEDYMSRLEISNGSQKDFYETSRELKANERMQILKALTSPKNKVIDLASLRKYTKIYQTSSSKLAY